MVKTWAVMALAMLTGLSTTRAACDDITAYLNIPNPLTEDTEIDLDGVDTIACEEYDPDDGPDMEVVTVSGAKLTLKSSSKVRFVNFGFTVTSGASLEFDMPKTRFGPNSEGFHRASYGGSFVEIEEGASAKFLGKVVARDVANVFSLFHNQGTLELMKSAVFEDGSNVFRVNTGTVKFRGTASFTGNKYLAVNNEYPGYMRFSKDVVFDNNAFQFDGAFGCSIANEDAGTKISFRGDVTVRNNDCDEGVAVYNAGEMSFYGKAYFENNVNGGNGGAVYNSYGIMDFKSAAQFVNNNSSDYGGGIATSGGELTFKKAVLFDGNRADSGAAFAVTNTGSLTFEKPSVVRLRNGVVDYDSDDDNCLYGEVEVDDFATVTGFPEDDVCTSIDT